MATGMGLTERDTFWLEHLRACANGSLKEYAEAHGLDVRGLRETLAEIYDPDPGRYGAGQRLGRSLRAEGSNGIAYDSVRDPAGECAAVFRANVLSPVVQGPHFCYVWDGEEIGSVYVKSEWRRLEGGS